MQDSALLFLAYGGPDSLADVEPYLLDVRGGRPTPPELVDEIRHRYAAIGGRSPLLEHTRRQAQATADILNRLPGAEWRFNPFVGMRHWRPYIGEAIAEIKSAGLQHIVALTMTPYSSRMTTQAYYEKIDAALANFPQWAETTRVVRIPAWYAHSTYIQALAEKVKDGLENFKGDGVQVVFTAHSLPAAMSEQGDPYAQQFMESARLTAQQAGLPEGSWRCAYQCANGDHWLGPALEETLAQLSQTGCRRVLVAPIGFVCDHVEVLYDLDIEAQSIARSLGLALARTASLNDDPLFVRALAEIVAQAAGINSA